jgi:hypothetical protein
MKSYLQMKLVSQKKARSERHIITGEEKPSTEAIPSK